MTSDHEEKWVTPLTSEPEILSEYTEKLGLDLKTANFFDIYGFDPESFSFTPKPVYAVIFLYPIGEKDGPLESRHKQTLPDNQIPSPRPWFSLQTVHNACGTMAILHAVMNNLDHVKLADGSWLSNFAQATANMTPDQRAKLIHNDQTLFSIHEKAANQSDLAVPEKASDHFVTFINLGGKLWELDGRKPQPICHGEVKDLLADSLAVIEKDYLPHIENHLMVSLLALSKPPAE